MLAALAALAVLAVVTIVVVISRGSDQPQPATGSGAATSAAATSSDEASSSSSAPAEPASNTVVDSDLKTQFTYTTDGYEQSGWGEPGDVTAGIVELHSMVAYIACTYDAGSDVLYGFTTSEQTDLAKAAQFAAVDLAKSVWTTSGEASITDPTAPSKKVTDEGVVGQLVEIESTRANAAPDECGTTTTHIAAFAFENAAGQVVVLVSSHRTDGDALKDADGFAGDVAATFQSVALVE